MSSKRLDFISQMVKKSRLAERVTMGARVAAVATGDILRGMLDRAVEPSNGTHRPHGIDDPVEPSTTRSSLADHLGKLVEKRLDQLSRNRNFKTADDPVEAVHDLRVASRRLRAFVDVFRPLLDTDVYESTEKPLRRITRAARSLRDLDIHEKLLVDQIDKAASDAERAALEHLLEALELGRTRAERRAEKRVGKVDFSELQVSVSAALGETVARLPHDPEGTAALAGKLIEPLIEQAARDRPADDGLEYPDEMHQLRIDLKKLRYGLELFEPTFGNRYSELYECVEKLQDLLGRHHDLVVLCDVVERQAEKLRRKDRQTLLVGLDTLHTELMRERRELLARYRTEGFEPPWWESSVRNALTGA